MVDAARGAVVDDDCQMTTRRRATRAKRLYDQRDFSELVELAQNGARDERFAALSALAALRRRHVVQPVAELLSDDDEEIRIAAATTLAKLGGETAVGALLSVQPETVGLRIAVADALGVLAVGAAEPQLTVMLGEPEDRVRAAAARALGRIRAVRAVDALGSALDDDKWWLRWRVREALIGIGTPEAVAALSANGRRSRLFRMLDVRAARRSLARHERRAAGELAGPLESLSVRLWSGAVKAVLTATAIVLFDVLVLGASPVLVGLVAVLVAAPFAWLLIGAADLVELARPRAEHAPADAERASTARTFVRTLASRPIAVVGWAGVPLAVEALLGGPGIVAALVVGVTMASAASRAFEALLISTVNEDLGSPLLVESEDDGLLRRRFFHG